MKKKILKKLCKVFFSLLLLYMIYVVGNVIYANKAIREFETALNNDNFNEFKEFGMHFKEEEESLKKFAYQKKKTYYLFGRVLYKYEISVADSTDVFENGIHVKDLLSNFEERYIKERNILKNVAKKTGVYSDYDERIDFDFPSQSGDYYSYRYPDYYNCFSFSPRYYSYFRYPVYPSSLNEKALYNLLENAAFIDEKEYTGKETDTITLFVKYNIFTHEFDGLDDFCAIKYGQELLNDATYMLYNSEVSITQELIKMYKIDKRELRLIGINNKVVSVYENSEGEYEGYVGNKFEKYIIENNLSVDEAITYLKSQGYKFGRNITLENDEYEKVELVFDGESLLWFDKESMTNEVEEKVNYLFENNTPKTEIIRELENMGYYQET